jgi:hypothetical protein
VTELRTKPAERPVSAQPTAGEQLALLDWKGIEYELQTTAEGTRDHSVLQRLRCGAADRPDSGALNSGVCEDARLGAGTSEGPQAPRPVHEVHAEGASSLREAESGLGRGESASRRSEEGEASSRTAAEEAAQAKGLRVDLLTLGGMRPGSGVVLLPAQGPRLWWLPCLKRALDSIREHCWFLAPSNCRSLYCPDCRGVA